MIDIRELPAVTQSGAGAGGTTVSTFPAFGVLAGLYVAFDSAGTLTVQTQHDPQTTLLTLTSAGTQWYYPRAQVHSTAGAGLTFDGSNPTVDKLALADYWQVIIDAAGTATVTMILG